MTPPGLVPLGVRVRVGSLPAGTAALAVAPAADVPGGATITVNAALGARGRGYALAAALAALASPRPADVPFAGVVAVRPKWRQAGDV